MYVKALDLWRFHKGLAPSHCAFKYLFSRVATPENSPIVTR